MRQLTLSPGLRLCKVRSDGGVDALLNILDTEEDLCPGAHFFKAGTGPLFSCHHAEWIHPQKCGGTHGALLTTNINHC
jgi:hypothetical protein